MSDQSEQRLEQLYRQTRREQPSAILDQHIRQAAVRALARRRRTWLLGLSSVAVLVLSVSVVLDLLWDDMTTLPRPERVDTFPDRIANDASPRPFSELESVNGYEDSIARQVPERLNGLVPSPSSPAPEEPRSRFAASREEAARQYRESQSELALAESTALHEKAQVLKKATESRPEDADIVIPELPYKLGQLVRLAAGLQGEQSESGVISLYLDNKLILSVRSVIEGHQFKAWQGSEVIGVKVSWVLTPDMFEQCQAGPVYLACELKAGVTGYFESDRLDHIAWDVPHG